MILKCVDCGQESDYPLEDFFSDDDPDYNQKLIAFFNTCEKCVVRKVQGK